MIAVVDRAYTDAELDAAIAAIGDPARLREAQRIVERSAPSLQRLLATAMNEGGWFDSAHDQAVREAAGDEDPVQRERAVRTLLAEETRLGMLVGVAVGFELARELSPSGEASLTSETTPSGEASLSSEGTPSGGATASSETTNQED
jgi:hypothetical protein